jgi:23S rRNA pseudouridine2604 synthase
MSFYRRIKYFLVHTLKYNNKDAQDLIDKGLVQLDGKTIDKNCFLNEESEIRVKDEIVRAAKEYIYIKFNKPAGYESTLSKNVPDNLSSFFKDQTGLSIAGRLDKASEGLLLLSNNGKWVEGITNPQFEKEKEYIVELDRKPDEAFARAFSSGVNIGYHVTRNCECRLLEGNKINVILREGKNRQIRKMCKTLNYNVLSLKRIRIDSITLGNLEAGKFDFFKV